MVELVQKRLANVTAPFIDIEAQKSIFMESLRPSLYFILLSCTLLVVDVTFSSFYIAISGNASSWLQTFGLSFLFLVIINISVGLLLFKNIRKQEAGINTAQGDLSLHIQKLPVKNAIWVFILTLIYTLCSISIGNFLLETAVPTEDMFATLYVAALWFILLAATSLIF